MTIRTHSSSKSFSEAIYLIDALIEFNADQSELRTFLMLLDEDNFEDNEFSDLHKIVSNHNKER